jgi:hypothetical protein
MAPLRVGPSQHRDAWALALSGGNDALLGRLAASDAPGAALFELATYVNGHYRLRQKLARLGELVGSDLGSLSTDDADARVRRVLPAVAAVRHRLNRREQREADLALLRWVRRASALSVVIGAGATMAAGGPSWPGLVRQLLRTALERGHELFELVPSPESTADSRVLVRQVVRTEHFAPAAGEAARDVLARIEAGATDTELLMRGAQLCYDLWGQHLFTHLSEILYGAAPLPGEIHHAIADLAGAQPVPDRGPGLFPGWDSIVTYNFDNLMGEALREQEVPHAAWTMSAGRPAGDPDERAREGGWYQPIFHLHGYTPRRFFRITDVEFVFSTSQYERTYGSMRSGILDHVLDEYLANPVHLALYVGCSFTDEAMNALLREAAARYPGRMHYALLRWPGRRGLDERGHDEAEEHAAPYLAMGVQPIWFDEFDEIPGLIRALR